MLYSLLFAALLSVDAIGVGLVCGFCGTKINMASRLAMAAVSAGFAAVSFFIGKTAESVLTPFVAELLGGTLLILAGVLLFVNTYYSGTGEADKDKSGDISAREAVILGFTLSVDMLGAGTGFACGEDISLLFPIFAGVFQYISLSLGIALGELKNKVQLPYLLTEKILPFAPSLIIIFLGFLKIF